MRSQRLREYSTSTGMRLAIVCTVMLRLGAALVITGRKAAVPSSGTLTTANTSGNPLTYTSGPFTISNPTDQANGVPTCDGTLPCDDYTLTVKVPTGSDVANYIKIQVSWPNQATLAQYDILVYKLNPDNSLGALTAANFFAVDPDVLTIAAISGNYLLRIAPTIAQGDVTTTKVTYEQKIGAAPVGSGLPARFQRVQVIQPNPQSARHNALREFWEAKIARTRTEERTDERDKKKQSIRHYMFPELAMKPSGWGTAEEARCLC